VHGPDNATYPMHRDRITIGGRHGRRPPVVTIEGPRRQLRAGPQNRRHAWTQKETCLDRGVPRHAEQTRAAGPSNGIVDLLDRAR